MYAGVPMIQFVAGREKPHLPGQAFPCRGVPTGSQRHLYDFVTANGTKNNDLWWYLACFSDGDCCAGPQRACTAKERQDGISCSIPCLEGWPSYMIDHTAIRNRMMQWATFRKPTTCVCFQESAELRAALTLDGALRI